MYKKLDAFVIHITDVYLSFGGILKNFGKDSICKLDSILFQIERPILRKSRKTRTGSRIQPC
nr:MAG: hypothetical protein EDM05_32540 [Leptolyngbya sp. IPPAS B-1204]